MDKHRFNLAVLLVMLSALWLSSVFFCFGQENGTASENLSSLVYRRHPSTKHLNCALIMANDQEYIHRMEKQRIEYSDEMDLSMDCQAIRQRNHFAEKALSNEEAQFPLAFARVVFMDYLLLEMELAAGYAPQNWYCYAIDEKADPVFKARMHSLADCFPNVFINDVQFEMDSDGHNMSFSHVECMKNLAKTDRKWEYVVLLQNHDMLAKTNQELVQIFKWLNGANDFEVKEMLFDRIDKNRSWNFRELNLFQKSRNGSEPDGVNFELAFAKGYSEGSLSRASVDFLVNDLNLTTVLSQMNDGAIYGVDEIFFQSLMTTEALDVPGGFTHDCVDRGVNVCGVTRYSAWYGDNTYGECRSNRVRHANCIFGIEDLPVLKDFVYLFVNKMMPEFDFGAVDCWYEMLFDRTNRERGLHRLKPDVYKQLPQVRYNAEKNASGYVNLSAFDCNANNGLSCEY